MPKRIAISSEVVADVITAARRRCCICSALRSDRREKKGQIAHLDRNPRNNAIDNLAFLCLEHHDAYDSKPSQSKGLTITEVKRYRAELHAFVAGGGLERKPNHSTVAAQYPRSPAQDGKDLIPSLKGFVKVDDCRLASESLLDALRSNAAVANILNGVYLPIPIPGCTIGDYGRAVVELFLPPTKRAYETQFPDRRFNDRIAATLAGNLEPARDGRQEVLIERLRVGPVVGILFPTAFQGFSVLAAREVMPTFPPGFVLSGVLDGCVAMTTYPDVLAVHHAPTLVCAGTTWNSSIALCFHPNEKELALCVADEVYALGSFSPGLLYIGE
jgi:hypothetical protein